MILMSLELLSSGQLSSQVINLQAYSEKSLLPQYFLSLTLQVSIAKSF